jgi:cytochrome c oxidase cbb3-type subunit 3
MARRFSHTLILLSCISVLGCGPLPGRPKPGPEVPNPDSIVDFATLYRQNCSACHGAQGMSGPSYPLANPTYQALVDEQVLHQAVANGEPGTLMPAFAISAGGSLTDRQVDALVTGMRAAWFKAGTLDGANPPPYKVAKLAEATPGQQVYTTYCASCHGAAGSSAKSKAGSITQPEFLALISDQALRTIVIAGRPDIGQPDWRNDLSGHPMSDQEVTEVVSWLSSQRPKAAGGGQ